MGGKSSKKKQSSSNSGVVGSTHPTGNVAYSSSAMTSSVQPQGFTNQMPNTVEEYYNRNVIVNPDSIGDFGPKEKIMINFAIKNPEIGGNYSVAIGLTYTKDSNDYKIIGQTENQVTTDNTGNVNFQTTVISEYFFEKQQYAQLIVRKGSLTACIKTTLGRLMGSRGQTLTLKIAEGTDSLESLILSANTLKNNNINIIYGFKVTAEGLNAPVFFVIKKPRSSKGSNQISSSGGNVTTLDQTDTIAIIKSEILQGLPGIFSDKKIPAVFLCNGDFDYPIIIEFHNALTRSMIGSYQTSVNKLRSSDGQFTVNGLIVGAKCDFVKEYTFLDYLRGGTQISVTFAIDFTGSNGEPQDEISLHYNGRPDLNLYEKAIRSCGDIIAYYDYDQAFPVYGYGAVLPSSNQTSMCFPLTLGENPNIQYIDGILQTYRNILPLISFSGPTKFAPVITQFLSNINPDVKNVYHILMILTDGIIEDMKKTISEIVRGSYLPISIVIIGIGGADFSNMVALDCDDGILVDSKGNRAMRDVVQFVPFSKFYNDARMLAEEVLKEIPRQIVDFYRMKNIPAGEAI